MSFLISDTELGNSFMCTFSVFWGSEMLCAHLYASMRNACMNPDVEFTVFKILFYETFIILNKNIFLQSSDTNLESNLVVKTL